MKYKDTKLFAFLKTFSKDELAEFEKFILSPYFSKGRDVFPLFKAVKAFYPEFNSDKLNEAYIFNELFPGKDFLSKKSKHILNTKSSVLLKMAEEFLVLSIFRNKKTLNDRLLIEELLNRGLNKYFESYRDSAHKSLGASAGLSEDNGLENFFIENLNTRYFSLTLDFNNFFQSSFKSLEHISGFFLNNLLRTAKLKYFAEMRNGIHVDNQFIYRMLNSMKIEDTLKGFEGTPVHIFLNFHYYTFLSLTNNYDRGHYETAKKIFFDNKPLFNRPEMNYFYSDLINLIDMSYNSSHDPAAEKEIFRITGSCIEDKAYKISDKDYMQPVFFRNVVIRALSLKEFEWAENFIDKFSDELKFEYRDNLINYYKAIVNFEKSEFEKSLEYITKVKYDLVDFKIDVKVVMLKIFYELELTEQAISLIDTFKHYLKGFKDTETEFKKSYLDFLNHTHKLLKIRESRTIEDLYFLNEEINKNVSIAQRKWLLMKAGKLKDHIISSVSR